MAEDRLKSFRSWSGTRTLVHPDSPDGGSGPGFARPRGPELDSHLRVASGVQHPDAPAGRHSSSHTNLTSTKMSGDQAIFNVAIEGINGSRFGKTKEGQKVVKKLTDLNKNGKIKYESMDDRGDWGEGYMRVNDTFRTSAWKTNLTLVHEGTHAVGDDELPPKDLKRLDIQRRRAHSVDDELRCENNELELYKEYREKGFTDFELEERLSAQKAGTLRQRIKRIFWQF